MTSTWYTLTSLWVQVTMLVVTSVVSAQDSTLSRPSRYSVTGMVAGGLALHSTDFVELPTLPNCCVPYTGGASPDASIAIGLDYVSGLSLFNRDVHVGVHAGMRLLPATLVEQEHVGNIISGSTVTDGTVEHELSLRYTAIVIEPYLTLPMPVKDFSLGIGIPIGIPLSAHLDQQQNLLTPSDPQYTFENGERARAKMSSSLPNAAVPQLNLQLRIRYTVGLFDNVSISPFIAYQHALNSITSAAPWLINSVNTGVQVAYHIPLPLPPPIIAPPPPPPPVRHVLASSVHIVPKTLGATTVNDTVFAPVLYEHITDTVVAVLPTLLFEYNSTEPIGGDTERVLFAQAIQQSMVDFSDQRERVIIRGSASFNEDPRLARERVSALLQLVKVDQNLVTIELVHRDSTVRPELAEEGRSVTVQLGERPRMLRRYAERKSVQTRSVELSALHTLTCENAPCTTSVTVQGAHCAVTETSSPVIPVIVGVPVDDSTSVSEPLEVVVQLTTRDAGGAQTSAEAAVVVVRTVAEVQRETVVINPDGTKQSGEVLLCLFEYGSDKFSVVDNEALDAVRTALRSGKSITVVAGTDDLGTPEYNAQLRRKRADAAIRLIGPLATGSAIEAKQHTAGAAHAPLTRIAQRGVWIRF